MADELQELTECSPAVLPDRYVGEVCARKGYSVRKGACGDDLYDTSKRSFVDLVWEIKIAYEG